MAAGGTADLRVWGNRGQLAAALGNLVENAVNYSPGPHPGRHSRPPGRPRRAGTSIEIAVTDQGIGISEKDRERIFERFYRVDPARSRATGGTGLGLAIVKHVAASHGGEVTVWSSRAGLHVHPAAAGGGRGPRPRDRPAPDPDADDTGPTDAAVGRPPSILYEPLPAPEVLP